MCGRYTLSAPADVLAELFDLDEVPELVARYNMAPTQLGAVVRAHGPTRRLEMMRWGLVPAWAKDRAMGSRLINARAETVAEKPAFRSSFRHQRCLVPADGFYEWQRLGTGKQPFHVRLRTGDPFAFAGLWSRWQDPESGELRTFTLLTTEPNELLRSIHHRMPVILRREDHARWLAAADGQTLSSLSRPYPAGEMEAVPVSRLVNSPAHDDVRCQEAIGHVLRWPPLP